MKVTYIGQSDERRITGEELARAGFDQWSSEDDDLVWGPGQTIDVDDSVGEWLTEVMRDQFKNRSDTTRDLRSKEELYEAAQRLRIEGRSTMSKDELHEAVVAAEIAKEEAQASGDASDALDGSISAQQEAPEES